MELQSSLAFADTLSVEAINKARYFTQQKLIIIAAELKSIRVHMSTGS